MMNRYEMLLQEADPTVRLLYWNWTTDPSPAVGFNFFTPGFMGASGRGTGGVGMGAPLTPDLNPSAADVPPATVVRGLSAGGPPAEADATVLARTDYRGAVFASNFSARLEGVPNHDSSHNYLGGGAGGVGDIRFLSRASRDPFFFLLHTKVDELWSRWQRANLSRLDSALTYGTASADPVITASMAPWNGASGIHPWTAAGGYIVSKTSLDRSVVSPPFYDTAPLTVPELQPGQAVILEIPWYPPNPANFSCFSDSGHFCLLSRIETASSAPFGMTTPETADVGSNTRNNNNIAWKNITVVDNFTGALMTSSVIIRNTARERVAAGLRFAADTDDFTRAIENIGSIIINLKPELFARWRQGGSHARGAEVVGQTSLRVAGVATIDNIRLEPGEHFSVDLQFELKKDYTPLKDARAVLQLLQVGAPGSPQTVVGGQKFEIDFSKISLIPERSQWRYYTGDAAPDARWRDAEYDDSKWRVGKSPLGWGDTQETIIQPANQSHSNTAYFRKAFQVADRGFLRSLLLRLRADAGAIVFINGREVHRVNLPGGVVSHRTVATREVQGAEELAFIPVKLSPAILNEGQNIVAVEVHPYSVKSGDLTFEVELSANRADETHPPTTSFLTVKDGTLVAVAKPAEVVVDAMDPDGHVRSVSLFANDKLIATLEKPPYRFTFIPAAGRNRLRAVVIDNDQQTTVAEVTVAGVAKVPPTVRITQPAAGAHISPNDAVTITAQTTGDIREVEFHISEGDTFDAPYRLIQRVRTAPFSAILKGLKPGHYMLYVVARDVAGEIGEASTHFMVGDDSHH
jgi:hypothetical protein